MTGVTSFAIMASGDFTFGGKHVRVRRRRKRSESG